ncbi:hypothetical protein [Pseudoalteromonas sp. NGC95]|nr:hypothetical protein [Pseudoalteromonas sp. NGC95]MBH0017858.1 hypothetical protein [Pseudoalteromonas sp. NGC95]
MAVDADVEDIKGKNITPKDEMDSGKQTKGTAKKKNCQSLKNQKKRM